MTCTALEKVKKTLLLCCHSQKVSMNKGLATSCESSPGSSSCFYIFKAEFCSSRTGSLKSKETVQQFSKEGISQGQAYSCKFLTFFTCALAGHLLALYV